MWGKRHDGSPRVLAALEACGVAIVRGENKPGVPFAPLLLKKERG
jgi:hypothetical protein